MTELPPEMTKNFGVTARKFSTKTTTSVDKDRSAWTDTPVDRARKEQVKHNVFSVWQHKGVMSSKPVWI